MKILAMEIEVDGINPEQFQLHLKAEARRVWELYQSGTLRELYFGQTGLKQCWSLNVLS